MQNPGDIFSFKFNESFLQRARGCPGQCFYTTYTPFFLCGRCLEACPLLDWGGTCHTDFCFILSRAPAREPNPNQNQHLLKVPWRIKKLGSKKMNPTYANWLFPKWETLLAELLSLTKYKTKSFGLGSSSRTQPKLKPILY